LARIAERIASKFPELSAEQIDRAIQDRFATVEDGRIRGFVAVRAVISWLTVDRAGCVMPIPCRLLSSCAAPV
jgi:hypothetical protein